MYGEPKESRYASAVIGVLLVALFALLMGAWVYVSGKSLKHIREENQYKREAFIAECVADGQKEYNCQILAKQAGL